MNAGSGGGTLDRSVLELVREDWQTHQRKWHLPGFHALAVYRLGAWVETLRRGPKRALAARAHNVLYIVVRNVYGIEIPRTARVGRRVEIGHQSGIVVGHRTEIGDECVIRQNVTIGAIREDGPEPRLGRRVEVGAGAVIAGDVTIGDGALIGPNAVVTTDVRSGMRVVAPASRAFQPGAEGPNIELAVPRPRGADGSAVAEAVRMALGLETHIDDDTPLISSGIVDSFNVPILLDALEVRFGVQIPTEQIDAETFDTPNQIAAVIDAAAAS